MSLSQQNQSLSNISSILKSDKSQQEKTIGHWNQEQQKMYVVFIDFFKREMKSKLKRRNIKIFKIMSQFVSTRDSVQCRCHHTKLIRTFGNVSNIVKDFKQRFGNVEYNLAKKQIVSSNCLFHENSKEMQKIKEYSASGKLERSKSVNVQTEEHYFEYLQKAVTNPSLTSLNNQAISSQSILYPCSFIWLFNS